MFGYIHTKVTKKKSRWGNNKRIDISSSFSNYCQYHWPIFSFQKQVKSPMGEARKSCVCDASFDPKKGSSLKWASENKIDFYKNFKKLFNKITCVFKLILDVCQINTVYYAN